MQIEDLRQIHDSYEAIYLSPHFDDAALSCGGAILSRVTAGGRVLVVTLCTRIPAADDQFSDLAREMHDQWGLSAADVVTARQCEDSQAMQQLGVDWYWAGMLDAIYRMPDKYDSRERLFGIPAPDDPQRGDIRRLVTTLAARAPSAAIYAPLGVGSHVDHLLTWSAARECGLQIRNYEDIPYVLHDGALEQRMATVDDQLLPATVDISAMLLSKFAAIESYSSQLDALFGGVESMRRALATYHASIGGERLWMGSSSPLV